MWEDVNTGFSDLSLSQPFKTADSSEKLAQLYAATRESVDDLTVDMKQTLDSAEH